MPDRRAPNRASGEAAGRLEAGVVREAPDLSKLLVESVPDSAIFALDPMGHVLSWNAGAQRFGGYAAEEILGRHFSIFYTSEDAAAGKPATALRRAAVEGRSEQEGWHVRKDGSRSWVIVVLSALRDQAGNLIGFAKITRDLTERRRADEALRESEARFRGAFDHAATGMAIADPAGRWIRVNLALSGILGYTEDELLSLSFPSITYPDDLPRNLAIFRRALAGEIDRYQLEKRFFHKQGNLVWVALNAVAVRDAAGALLYFVVQMQDITESKRAEALLRGNEERYRVLFDRNPLPMWLYDVDTFAFLAANDAAVEQYGYSREEFLAMTIPDIHVAEDLPAMLAEHARAALTSGRDFAGARRHRKKDGTLIEVELHVDEVALGSRRVRLALAQDVTQRQRAEEQRALALEALRSSEERFRALIEHAADPVGILDEAGIYRYASPAHEHVLGYTPEELLGTSAFALLHPDDVTAVVATLQQLTATPDATPMLVCRMRHKNGRWRILVVVGRNFLHHPAIRGIVVNAADVTEREALEAQLRQAQKMEALGQLAGGIAHDFNNLLTAIFSNTDLLLHELGEGAARQDVEVIRQTAERAAGLTRQLLAFSRKQVVQPRLVDLNAVVTETERMLRRTLGSGTRLQADLALAVSCVLADPGQLEQVLVNLALNARDAMPAGGTLTLRTREVVMDEVHARRYKGLRPGAYVALTVEDTGVGIPPELQVRIFEPFFTTKPVGQGTGLGLSTVYGIVKQWGGYTAVDSMPGTGTTFTIYLPQQAGTPQPEESAAGGRLPTGTETILVVEDETTVRNSIRRILTRHGYTVLEARHGAEALRIMREATRPIGLVMTDLVMPEMGGRELIATLGEWSAPPKILVMSGYDAQAGMRGEPLPPGTNFIPKPFTVDGVLQAVRAALDATPRSRPFVDR